MQVCVKNNADELTRLLDGGADIACRDEAGRTPLHVAAWFGSSRCVGVLLRHGANPSGHDSSGTSPLATAVQRNAADIVQMLLTDGCDAREVHPKSGRTLLDIAVECDASGAGAVSALLAAGADPRAKNEDGTTAYMTARRLKSRAFPIVADAALSSLLRR